MDWIEGFNGAARDFIDCIISGEQPVMDFGFSRKVLQAALGVVPVVGEGYAGRVGGCGVNRVRLTPMASGVDT